MITVSKTQLDDLLKNLKNKYEVFDVRNDVLPIKRFFFPPEENIFIIDNETKKISYEKNPKNFVLFGVSFRDLQALNYLDEIMSKPNKDFYYFRRREKSTIIGITNEDFLIPPTNDLIFKELDNGHYEIILNEHNKKFFESFHIKPVKISGKKALNKNSEMTELKKLLLTPELLKDAVEWSWDNYPKIWNDLGKKCLTCGICTYVCPLCHCFSIEDRVSLSGKNCLRCRKWDACTLPNFSRIAGGYKFHKTIKERYYNWFYHKFVRGYYEFGESQCVACGRCKKYCPADINIEEIILNILKKYNLETRSPSR